MIILREMREQFGTKLKIKQKSLIMRFLGIILFFNRSFMDSFITVIGKTIYFPDNWETIIKICEAHLEDGADEADFPVVHTPEARRLFAILCHEYVHQKDYKNNKLFPILYVFPTIYAIPGLIGLIVSFWHHEWILLSPFLLYAIPVPAYWRSYFEARGYATNTVLRTLLYGTPQRFSNSLSNFYMEHFTSSSYYWMAGHPWYNKIIGVFLGRKYVNGVQRMVQDRLNKAVESIETRDSSELDELEHVYRIVSEVQKKNNW
jgi:hypothetical protein